MTKVGQNYHKNHVMLKWVEGPGGKSRAGSGLLPFIYLGFYRYLNLCFIFSLATFCENSYRLLVYFLAIIAYQQITKT